MIIIKFPMPHENSLDPILNNIFYCNSIYVLLGTQGKDICKEKVIHIFVTEEKFVTEIKIGNGTEIYFLPKEDRRENYKTKGN